MLHLRALVSFSAVLLLSGPALASTVDLTSGTTGTLLPGLSYAETRGAEVTVLSASDQTLTALTLASLDITAPTATVYARVYESNTGFPIASAQTGVVTGNGQTVTLPMSGTLVSSRSYRVGFYVSAAPGGAHGTMFDPAPSDVGGFPYTVAGGALSVVQGYRSAGDAFPTTTSIAIPRISLELCEADVPLDLVTGTTGTNQSGQSFGHTRGVAVSVGSGCGPVYVESITLSDLNSAFPNTTVGARIYDDASTELLASADSTIGAGNNQTITLPLSVTLAVGGQYRVCWFNHNPGGAVNGAGLDADPPGIGISPYTETNGRVTILAAYSAPTDMFPTVANALVPHITLNASSGPARHVEYCFGTASDPSHTTACPCGNTGAPGNGCANSVNAAGGHLGATGATNPDAVVLAGSGMPQSVICIYMQQDALGDSAFGDGVNCAGGNLIRLRSKMNSNGASQFPEGTDTVTVSQRGAVTPGSGVTRYYAAYYRNASATFCPPLTYNITNGCRIIW